MPAPRTPNGNYLQFINMRILGYTKQRKTKTNLVVSLEREVYRYGRDEATIRRHFSFRDKPAVGAPLYQDQHRTGLALFPRGTVFEAAFRFKWLNGYRGISTAFTTEHEGEELQVVMGSQGTEELLKALETGVVTMQNQHFVGNWTFYNASGNCWVQPYTGNPAEIQPIPANWLEQ